MGSGFSKKTKENRRDSKRSKSGEWCSELNTSPGHMIVENTKISNVRRATLPLMEVEPMEQSCDTTEERSNITTDGNCDPSELAVRSLATQNSSNGGTCIIVSGTNSNKQPSKQQPTTITRKISTKRTPSPPTGGKKSTSRPTPDQKIDWTKGPLIGTGSFGKVYRGLDNATGKSLAIKEVLISSSQILKDLKKEIELLKTVHHKNIVDYLGIERVKQSAYILMEYVPGGTLSTLIRTFKGLKEPVARNYTREILDGVAYLHSYRGGIVHRDIKGANILITPDGHVKLVDFGSAKSMVATECSSSIREGDAPFKTVRGTPFWMAPEVIRESGHGPPADIWSIGCTIIEMLTGKPPYSDCGAIQAMHLIASGKGLPPLGLDTSNVSVECVSFIEKCLNRDPDLRPKCLELIIHPWITKHLSPEKEEGEQFASTDEPPSSGPTPTTTPTPTPNPPQIPKAVYRYRIKTSRKRVAKVRDVKPNSNAGGSGDLLPLISET